MTSNTDPSRRTGRYKRYDRLDLTGVQLPPGLLRSARGRADLLATARERGYPARLVTPVVTRWGRFYVVQLAADRDQATVTLALAAGGEAVVKLPPQIAYRTASPTRLYAMLAGLRDQYPPLTPTATVTQALIAVLDHCAAAAAAGRPSVGVQPLEEAITAELRPHLDLWSTPDQLADPADT